MQLTRAEKKAARSKRRKASGVTGGVVPPTGPNALFNVPGAGPSLSRRLRRLKAAGEQITGNLCRGEDGGFAACDGDGGSAAASEADKLNRAAERDKRREEERAALNAEKDPEKRRALREEFRQRRQAERQADRERAAGDRVSRAEERDKKRQEREAAREEKRRAAEEAKKLKPKKGGGGGSDKPAEEEDPEVLARRAALLEGIRRRIAGKAMRPGRLKLWRSAYAEAKAAGHDRAGRLAAAKGALKRDTAERMRRQYERATLAVFKDARGVDRWAAISSTAYRDRDGEIVSRKALVGAVNAADAAGSRGPLRFWHVPGLDLGDCDYQAVTDDGRFLLESGTFRSAAYASALKAAGPWQVSIGFTHPPTEPDSGGVFHHIRIFERSLVPTGRASNRFTAITTKEPAMLPAEKLKALKELLGADGAAQLLGTVDTTAKAADAAGVAFKSTDAPTVYTGPDGAPGIIVDGAWVALKAVAEKAPMPPEQMMQAAMTEAADAEAELVEEGAEAPSDDDDAMDLTVGDLKRIIGDAVLMAMGGSPAEYASKMAEMKAQYEAMGKAFGSMQAQKDAAAAAQAAELTALKESRDALAAQLTGLDARLKELEGDQPALKGGYRASADPATVSTAFTAALKQAPNLTDPYAAADAYLWGEQ